MIRVKKLKMKLVDKAFEKIYQVAVGKTIMLEILTNLANIIIFLIVGVKF